MIRAKIERQRINSNQQGAIVKNVTDRKQYRNKVAYSNKKRENEKERRDEKGRARGK